MARNDFLSQLRRRQEALRRRAEPKDPSEMSGEELEAEIKRLEEKIRANQEIAVAAGRQELEQQRSRRSPLSAIFGRRTRRPWK